MTSILFFLFYHSKNTLIDTLISVIYVKRDDRKQENKEESQRSLRVHFGQTNKHANVSVTLSVRFGRANLEAMRN